MPRLRRSSTAGPFVRSRVVVTFALVVVALAGCSLTNAPAPSPSRYAYGSSTSFDFPDPFVFKVGADYFAYSTDSALGNMPVMHSSDAKHWTVVGDALPTIGSWATPGLTWAPGVVQRGNTFVLYYAALMTGAGKHCIGVATAASPTGPFVDHRSTPLLCSGQGDAIDPSPFVMPWGALYLTFEAPTPNGPRVWVNQLAADGQSLVGPAAEILAPEFRWEAKTSPRSGVVENPYMLVTNAGLYLFYSANNWQTDEYAIGVAKCVTPIGPCLRVYTTSFVHSTGTIVGPGGASIAAMPDGSLQLFFHAWVGGIGYDAGGVRELFSTPLRFYLGVPIASGQP